MKIKLFLLLLITGSICLAFPSMESAYVLQKGERANGIFQPMRYGLGNDMELQTHRIQFLVHPNVTLQRYRGKLLGFDWACRHHLSYPTLLLKLIQKEGIAGIIAPDPDIDDIPQMLYWRSDFLFSRNLGKSMFTAKAGFAIGLGGKDMDERLWIDYPMVFHRMGVLFNGWGLSAGADLRVPLADRWDILVDADLYSLPGADYGGFFEHKALLTWQMSEKLALTGGYKLSHGEYPFGSQWYMVPLFDVIWTWRK